MGSGLRNKRRFRIITLGAVVKRIVSLLGAVVFLLSPDIPAQQRIADQPPRYHLIQVVEATFLEKVNDTARQGYRLIAMTAVPGSFVAIMERADQTPAHFNYLAVPVRGTKNKYETAGKTKTEVAQQLNAAGEKGYRLRMTLGNLVVMESNSDPATHYQYALTSPGGFGYFKKDEISDLISAGYQWSATAITFLIFEKALDSNNSHDASETRPHAVPYSRFTFPENNIVRRDLPEKQLHKLASEGARVVDFFGSPMQMILAMEETVPPAPPYQYIVLKPRNQASPLALHAKMSKVEAADLSSAGQQGFRLLSLSAPAPPFVMEKSPGSTKHYEYQLITATRLAELAEQLNGPGTDGFHVAKLAATDDGFLVVLEKSDAE
jgi:hypothetical protein